MLANQSPIPGSGTGYLVPDSTGVVGCLHLRQLELRTSVYRAQL